MKEQTITATEFKAKCLDLLDQVASKRLDRVTVTKRGKVVGMLVPPATPSKSYEDLWSCMTGTVFIAADAYLTEPVIEPARTSIYPFGDEDAT